MCPDGYVYNIEVEDGHTYFANGILSHNCHLAITPTVLDTIEHFCEGNPNIRALGLTATPDRADGRSLAIAFKHCSYQMSIREATHQGWLVPVRAKLVHIDTLDLSMLPGGSRDWSSAQIARYMEAHDVVLKTAQITVELAPRKQTLIYCARVAHAEAVAKRINHLQPGTCAVVHGNTPVDERRQIIDAFKRGELRRIANCGVLTTGFDAPNVECIVVARPTKSRSLFAQIVGRGLRPLPGTVDGLGGAAERRDAIAASAKPHCEVLSVVGKDASMNLASPVDMLAGSMDRPELIERAKELMDEGVEDPEDALIQAEEDFDQAEREAMLLEDAPVRVHLGYRVEDANLYSDHEFRMACMPEADVPAQRHVDFLITAGFKVHEMRGWSGTRCKDMVEVVRTRYQQGMSSKKQCDLLKKLGVPKSRRVSMTKREAQEYIQSRIYARG